MPDYHAGGYGSRAGENRDRAPILEVTDLSLASDGPSRAGLYDSKKKQDNSESGAESAIIDRIRNRSQQFVVDDEIEDIEIEEI